MLNGFRFRCYGTPGDGKFRGGNGINGAGKGYLDGAAYLSAIDARSHYGTKGAYVKECLAHPGFCLIVIRLFGILLVDLQSHVGPVLLVVQDGFFLNINFVAGFAVLGQLNEIADLAFQAYVCNQAMAGFSIHARQVSRIRITVRVGVCDVKQNEKVNFVHYCQWFVF